MNQGSSPSFIYCSDHRSQHIIRVNPNPQASKHIYCGECLIQAGEIQDLDSSFPTVSNFISSAAAIFDKEKKQVKPVSQIPKEYLDTTALQTESLENFSNHITREKGKIQTFFKDIADMIVETLDQLKNDYLEALDRQMVHLRQYYDEYKTFRRNIYVRNEDIHIMFPAREVIKEIFTMRIKGAADLEEIIKDMKQTIEARRICFDRSDDAKQKFLADFETNLWEIESQMPVFEEKCSTHTIRDELKKQLSQALKIENAFTLENDITLKPVKPDFCSPQSDDYVEKEEKEVPVGQEGDQDNFEYRSDSDHYKGTNEEGILNDDFLVINYQLKKDEQEIKHETVEKEIVEDIKIEEGKRARNNRFFGAEVPKTYNNVFGSLDHFLLFFKSRGPEIDDFVNAFTFSERYQDLTELNRDILPYVIDSIRKEATETAVTQKSKKSLIKLFDKTFTSHRQFYDEIIKAYTMETFLYKNMNTYLRNEDWIQLDRLLPYVFCLCKAILSIELSQNQLQETNQEQKMVLYRGGQLDEASLNFYNSEKKLVFSWNAVTSTSTNRNVAEVFMQSDTKIPVMFVIEVPHSLNTQEKRTWLDIKSFSAYSDEDEIILAPGSVFEVKNFHRDEKGSEIQLTLVTNVNTLATQGRIMYGALQAGMQTGKKSQIIGLEEKDLSEAIIHLKGNQLIEELEFSLCKFDKGTLTSMAEILPTISRLVKVSYSSVFSDETAHLQAILNVLRGVDVKELQIYDQSLKDPQQIILFAQEIKNLNSVTTLSLNFGEFKDMGDEELVNLWSQGIRYMPSLKNLKLDLKSCSKIADEGLERLGSQGLKYLTSLTSLILNLAYCNAITDKGLETLCSQGLRYLTSLKNVDLNLSGCYEITDKGLDNLCSQGINYLTSLQTFKLNVIHCSKITDQAYNQIRSQASLLKFSLTLHCDDGEGLRFAGGGLGASHFKLKRETSEAFSYAKLVDLRNASLFLESLDDSFSSSQCRTSIQHLFIDLSKGFLRRSIQKVTDEILNTFCSNGLKYMTSLTALKISLTQQKQVTDKGLEILCSQGIRHMPLLTTLCLSFSDCSNITDAGLESLCFQGLKYSTSLTSLTLDFARCDEITDKGLELLCSQGLRYLPSLVVLNLDFSECNQLTNKSLFYLNSQGIKRFSKLKVLALNFKDCRNITSDGIYSLCYQGLRYSVLLEILDLTFPSSEGLNGVGVFLHYLGFIKADLDSSDYIPEFARREIEYIVLD